MPTACIVLLALMSLWLCFSLVFSWLCYTKIFRRRDDSTELPQCTQTSPHRSPLTQSNNSNRNRNHSRNRDQNPNYQTPTNPNVPRPTRMGSQSANSINERGPLFAALTPREIIQLPLLHNGRVVTVEGRQVVAESNHIRCTVCQDSVAPGHPFRVLPCSHMSHARCSFYWLLESSRCPHCGTCVREALSHYTNATSQNGLDHLAYAALGRMWVQQRQGGQPQREAHQSQARAQPRAQTQAQAQASARAQLRALAQAMARAEARLRASAPGPASTPAQTEQETVRNNTETAPEGVTGGGNGVNTTDNQITESTVNQQTSDSRVVEDESSQVADADEATTEYTVSWGSDSTV